MKTDTSEKGLETLIMRHMTGVDGLSSGASDIVAETAPLTGGSGWFAGHAASYDREFAVDVEQLFAFLVATQPEETAKLGIGDYKDRKTSRGRSSSPGCRERSPGAARLTCCGMASSTAR